MGLLNWWLERGFLLMAHRGKTDSVKFYLERGVNVNAKDKRRGLTALMRAAGEGHIDTVQVLLDAGADVNMKDNEGVTALMWAINFGHNDTKQALLDAGAEYFPDLSEQRKSRYDDNEEEFVYTDEHWERDIKDLYQQGFK